MGKPTMHDDISPHISSNDIVAQVVFRHNPAATPQWSYYGINAPLAGTAIKLSEAKFAATQDLKFLSGEESPALRSYVEWAVTTPHEEGESEGEVSHLDESTEVQLFVRAAQDDDTNLRLHRQNLAQAYLEGVRATVEIQEMLPTLLTESAPSNSHGGPSETAEDGPLEIILITLFPDDLLGDALLNLTEREAVVFCLPDGDSLSFLPMHGEEVWPTEGPGMLELMGLDEFATVRNLMELSDGDGDTSSQADGS